MLETGKSVLVVSIVNRGKGSRYRLVMDGPMEMLGSGACFESRSPL